MLRYERRDGHVQPATYAGLTQTERAVLLNLSTTQEEDIA